MNATTAVERPCRECGDESLPGRRQCQPCRAKQNKARRAAYYLANRQAVLAASKVYREAHSEELRAYVQAHRSERNAARRRRYAEDPEKFRVASRQYAAKHRGAVVEKNTAYYTANREELRARSRERYAARPEEERARARANRRANREAAALIHLIETEAVAA